MTRFWTRVEIGSLDECWEWQGATAGEGYGTLRLSNPRRMVYAHRYVYELAFGPTPLHVCHHCDNPLCVNPLHLFAGTDQDNHDDKVAKSRQLKGMEIHQSKLTDDQVCRIRELKGEKTQKEIAKMFGVSRSLISMIHSGKLWKHIQTPVEVF